MVPAFAIQRQLAVIDSTMVSLLLPPRQRVGKKLMLAMNQGLVLGNKQKSPLLLVRQIARKHVSARETDCAVRPGERRKRKKETRGKERVPCRRYVHKS